MTVGGEKALDLRLGQKEGNEERVWPKGLLIIGGLLVLLVGAGVNEGRIWAG